jgi:hypothetical protein
MRLMFKASLAALLLAGSFTVAGTAYAFESTPMERAELDQLSPQLRQDVEARMVSGQSVHGVLDTTSRPAGSWPPTSNAVTSWWRVRTAS